MKKKKNSKLTLIKLKVSSLNGSNLIFGGDTTGLSTNCLTTQAWCNTISTHETCGRPTWGGSHCKNGSTGTTKDPDARDTFGTC